MYLIYKPLVFLKAGKTQSFVCLAIVVKHYFIARASPEYKSFAFAVTTVKVRRGLFTTSARLLKKLEVQSLPRPAQLIGLPVSMGM